MELRVLQYFLAVVREESITKAAEVLHITQPTLSRQLTQLEEEVGVKLFVRGSRHITLTNEGMLLRRRAEEISELVDKTERELNEQDEQVDGTVSIGCGELEATKVLPPLIAAFHERYPLVKFDLYTGNADLVTERMDRGLIDIGLLLEPVDIDKYEFIRLNVQEHWAVIMRPDAPLAKKKSVTAADLDTVPLILPSRIKVQGELASWFGDYYSKLNVLFRSNFSTNACVMVEQGLGYVLTIEGARKFLDDRILVRKRLDPELTATTVLAWKRQQPFSLAVSKFIEHIKCFKGIGEHEI
jgi:DNA-binding transcriptional LysR family regulator